LRVLIEGGRIGKGFEERGRLFGQNVLGKPAGKETCIVLALARQAVRRLEADMMGPPRMQA
jgi:hypothetical protein